MMRGALLYNKRKRWMEYSFHDKGTKLANNQNRESETKRISPLCKKKFKSKKRTAS